MSRRHAPMRLHPSRRTDPIEPKTWRARAACRGDGPGLFFADDDASIEAAKAICAACPVRTECLEDAVAGHEYGVWGGTTGRQRAQLRSLRRQAS